MKRLNRAIAIEKLVMETLKTLDVESRESYILDWWSIDEEDEEFSLLSNDLKNEILLNEDCSIDFKDKKYNELIEIALCSEYRGVTNEYLAETLAANKFGRYEIQGVVENLDVCPCCNFRTLLSRGNYEICRLCNWEDDGIDAPEAYSGPNHMTLKEAQRLFETQSTKLPLNKWVKSK